MRREWRAEMSALMREAACSMPCRVECDMSQRLLTLYTLCMHLLVPPMSVLFPVLIALDERRLTHVQ